jgi:hypothetical protein
MSEVKVNKISPRTNCGTVQLGDSGDTITIPAGATITNNGTQTGFGRTGTVNWDTTAKTASFTAVSGNGYFVNTTSGAITVTLPASPSAGDIVAVADYAGTAATNAITVARNGSNFEGGTENGGINTNRQTGTFVYVDGTQGWVVVNSNDSSFILPAYVTATGGTITTSGNFKIHTFTGPGTFTVSCAGNAIGSNTVDYLVVAGGGGGGANAGGGGGGAGGYRESSGAASGSYTISPLGSCVSALPVTAQGYSITVGGGGNGGSFTGSEPGVGSNGNPSVFSTITSTAGGKGGGATGTGNACAQGGPGGSGGGGGFRYFCGNRGEGGSGNTPPVSPPQGKNGGAGAPSSSPTTIDSGGGGGGATVAGTQAGNSVAGVGGAGATSCITASPVTRAGGGGGGSEAGPDGAGGSGGGGAGGANGTAGTTNTGGGGGGAAGCSAPNSGGYVKC